MIREPKTSLQLIYMEDLLPSLKPNKTLIQKGIEARKQQLKEAKEKKING